MMAVNKTTAVLLTVMLAVTGCVTAVMISSDSDAISGSGTSTYPYTYLDGTADVLESIDGRYVSLGCVFNIRPYEASSPMYFVDSVSPGFGLTVESGGLTGSVQQMGDITVAYVVEGKGTHSISLHVAESAPSWTVYADTDYTLSYEGGNSVGAVSFTFISDKTAQTPPWVSGWSDYSITIHSPSEPGRYQVPMIVGMVSSLTGDTSYFERSFSIQVVNKPQVDLTTPQIDAQLDDYLNPAHGDPDQGHVTLEMNEDRAIRLKPGTYNFKLDKWWLHEDHYADLKGDTHGLTKDTSGNWVGQLAGGETYEFTVNVGNKGEFTFSVKVNDVTRTITYDNEGTTSSSTVGWGDSFTLPEATLGTYAFEGWYDSEGNRIGGANDTYAIYSDTTLEAKWVSVVTFVNPAGLPNEQRIEKDGTILIPIAVMEGSVFLYWSEDPQGDGVYSEGNEYVTPSGSVTLYPIFETEFVIGPPNFVLIGSH